MKWPTVTQVEGELPWVTYGNKRVYKDNNCLNLLVLGGPGSGKSWGLLSYCCLLNPDFNIQEQCFFRAKQLIRTFQREAIIKGRAYMYDEAGYDAGNLKWQDEINKGLSIFFQTARYKNYILGMTFPYASFISKGVRKLMNAQFTAHEWTSDNLTKIKPLTLQWNDEMEKYYRKRLLVKSPNGIAYCNEIRLPRPPKKIRIEYEKLKKEFTQDLYKDIADKLDMEDQKQNTAKLFKCSSLSKELGINNQTMIDWITKGLVEAKRIGRSWYCSPEERERVLENPDRAKLLRNGAKSDKIANIAQQSPPTT